MQILIAGGTGFIGSYVLRRLAASEHSVRVLLRERPSGRLAVDSENVHPVEGDIRNAASLDAAMKGCDAVINVVGILRELPEHGITFESVHAAGARNVAEAAVRAGVHTFVHMSSNGASPDGVSRYQTTKWEAERAVEASGFEKWTIFRPSIVFGKPDPGRSEFATDLVRRLIKPFPILPVFGDGAFRLQPVAVASLAEGVVKAVEGLGENSVFEAAGPEAFRYTEVLDRLTLATGSTIKPKIRLPIPLVSAGIAALGWTGLLPITSDELNMLVEGNTCDFGRFHEVFDLEPIPFSVENLSYLAPV